MHDEQLTSQDFPITLIEKKMLIVLSKLHIPIIATNTDDTDRHIPSVTPCLIFAPPINGTIHF